MTNRIDDQAETTDVPEGSAHAGGSMLGGILESEDSASHDLGPMPIGSDPWLVAEVEKAIAREHGVDASVVVEASDAVVTLRGTVAASDAPRIVSAARSVAGIASLRDELVTRS